ncbi:Oligosaccharide translocation protein rft1 [Onygenales sp. PD_12]|nr:Oligosaccharide translocation protein rft1 [Onygenales sp. PD_12]
MNITACHQAQENFQGWRKTPAHLNSQLFSYRFKASSEDGWGLLMGPSTGAMHLSLSSEYFGPLTISSICSFLLKVLDSRNRGRLLAANNRMGSNSTAGATTSAKNFISLTQVQVGLGMWSEFPEGSRSARSLSDNHSELPFAGAQLPADQTYTKWDTIKTDILLNSRLYDAEILSGWAQALIYCPTIDAKMTVTQTTPLPPTLPIDLSRFPKLSLEQAGHLRHFHNISTALDGEWPHMGTQEPDQAFLDAYRYQLATMAYAAGLTHYHRLPALRNIFKPLIRKLIHKMLRREVWSYWYLTSQSGNRLDPELTELRKPWADPIVKENIMYSGHLLLMTSLYAMLFDDDEFEREGSLVFDWAPLFWGMGHEKYVYNNGSLQKAILNEMERCVLEKYWTALQQKNMIRDDGLFSDWHMVKQDVSVGARGVAFTAWASAFMNTWNSTFVRASYPRQSLGFLTTNPTTETTTIQHPVIGQTIRDLASTTSADPNSPTTIATATNTFLTSPHPPFPYTAPHFGYVVKWLSELGKRTELDSLLAYADERFNPTWERGGLYYPRQDKVVDEQGAWTFVDPFSGNAAIGYARLNVEDGQRGMWEAPWTGEVLGGRPWVDGGEGGLEGGVDWLRGRWVEEDGVQAMVVTVRAWDGNAHEVAFVVRGLSGGVWGVYVRGSLVQEVVVEGEKGDMDVECVVQGEGVEVDVVVFRGEW